MTRLDQILTKYEYHKAKYKALCAESDKLFADWGAILQEAEYLEFETSEEVARYRKWLEGEESKYNRLLAENKVSWEIWCSEGLEIDKDLEAYNNRLDWGVVGIAVVSVGVFLWALVLSIWHGVIS